MRRKQHDDVRRSYLLWIIIFLLCISIQLRGISQGIADREIGGWRLTAGAVASRSSVTDKKFSTVPFTAIVPGLTASIQYSHRHAGHDIHICYIKGQLKSDKSLLAGPDQKMFTLDYANLYVVYRSGNGLFTGKTGGGLQLFYTGRKYNDFINSNHSFEMAASLGPVAEITCDLPGALAGFSLLDRFTLPVVFLYAQSPYGADVFPAESSGKKSDLGNFFAHNKLAAIPGLLRFSNSMMIQKNITSRQQLAVSYNWDFYHIKTSQDVRRANHQLIISYSYML